MLKIWMLCCLLYCNSIALFNQQHLLQQISQLARYVSLGDYHLLLDLLQNAHYFEGIPRQPLEEHEVDGDT